MENIPVPDREELRQLLLKWADGGMSFHRVVEEAEALEERLWQDIEIGPEFPATDPRTIAVEVLTLLSMGFVAPLFSEDIPHILEYLATPSGSELEGAQKFHGYFETLDYQERLTRGEQLYDTNRG